MENNKKLNKSKKQLKVVKNKINKKMKKEYKHNKLDANAIQKLIKQKKIINKKFANELITRENRKNIKKILISDVKKKEIEFKQTDCVYKNRNVLEIAIRKQEYMSRLNFNKVGDVISKLLLSKGITGQIQSCARFDNLANNYRSGPMVELGQCPNILVEARYDDEENNLYNAENLFKNVSYYITIDDEKTNLKKLDLELTNKTVIPLHLQHYLKKN